MNFGPDFKYPPKGLKDFKAVSINQFPEYKGSEEHCRKTSTTQSISTEELVTKCEILQTNQNYLILCCLHHNKADVKNVSICTTYLKFVHFRVILNVNSSCLLYVIAYNMGWNSLCYFINRE